MTTPKFSAVTSRTHRSTGSRGMKTRLAAKRPKKFVVLEIGSVTSRRVRLPNTTAT
jgi:hypothetical protein